MSEEKKLKEFYVLKKEIQFKRVMAHSEEEVWAMKDWVANDDWDDYDTNADDVWVECTDE
tara:strand:+ start:350 stop:529 length:180 start_codon:yes stop_codon:yes gene_type:complete